MPTMSLTPTRVLVVDDEPDITSLVVHDERSEEHTSELQSQSNLVCRLLLEKKKINATPRLNERLTSTPTTHIRIRKSTACRSVSLRVGKTTIDYSAMISGIVAAITAAFAKD